MKKQIDNSFLSGIDKYSGSFDQDELGVTMIPTATIKLLNNFTLLGLFTFLSSCASDWKLNAKHLATHFECNKDKIYKAIDSLIELKLLTRSQIRDKGKFVRYHYRLHLRPIQEISPCLEKPDTVKPDPVNPDTYKTNILPLQNKEEINTTTGEPVKPQPPPPKPVVVKNSSSKEKTQLSDYEKKQLTDVFNRVPFATPCIQGEDDFLNAALYSITNREETISRQQRVHGILKLVRLGLFEEPPLWAKEQRKIREGKQGKALQDRIEKQMKSSGNKTFEKVEINKSMKSTEATGLLLQSLTGKENYKEEKIIEEKRLQKEKKKIEKKMDKPKGFRRCRLPEELRAQ